MKTWPRPLKPTTEKNLRRSKTQPQRFVKYVVQIRRYVMPRILLPDGSTRMVDALNPGDILANGQSSALDAGPVIAGEGAPSGSIAQVENPGFDADSPN